MPNDGYYTINELVKKTDLNKYQIIQYIEIGIIRGAVKFKGDYVVKKADGDNLIAWRKISDEKIKNEYTDKLTKLIANKAVFYAVFIKTVRNKHHYKILYANSDQIVNATDLFIKIFDWPSDANGSIIFNLPKDNGQILTYISLRVSSNIDIGYFNRFRIQDINW